MVLKDAKLSDTQKGWKPVAVGKQDVADGRSLNAALRQPCFKHGAVWVRFKAWPANTILDQGVSMRCLFYSKGLIDTCLTSWVGHTNRQEQWMPGQTEQLLEWVDGFWMGHRRSADFISHCRRLIYRKDGPALGD